MPPCYGCCKNKVVNTLKKKSGTEHLLNIYNSVIIIESEGKPLSMLQRKTGSILKTHPPLFHAFHHSCSSSGCWGAQVSGVSEEGPPRALQLRGIGAQGIKGHQNLFPHPTNQVVTAHHPRTSCQGKREKKVTLCTVNNTFSSV